MAGVHFGMSEEETSVEMAWRMKLHPKARQLLDLLTLVAIGPSTATQIPQDLQETLLRATREWADGDPGFPYLDDQQPSLLGVADQAAAPAPTIRLPDLRCTVLDTCTRALAQLDAVDQDLTLEALCAFFACRPSLQVTDIVYELHAAIELLKGSFPVSVLEVLREVLAQAREMGVVGAAETADPAAIPSSVLKDWVDRQAQIRKDIEEQCEAVWGNGPSNAGTAPQSK